MRSVLTALCLFATTAHAVPAQFTHQGRLLDAEGIPLEGEATITFRVITEETGGEVLWQEPITVDLNAGFYAAVLGTDEETNPLDTDVLGQAPVWLELQLDGEPAMVPRSAINAVPYATMATVAEEVSGGPVDASQIAVDGTPVVNELGEWVGPAPTVNWSDIEGMPDDFADGVDDDTDTDTDSFAALGTSCLDGDIAVWDGVAMEWVCDIERDTLADLSCTDGQLIAWSDESTGFVCADDIDTVLTEDEVDAIVADNGYAMSSELFSSSFLDLTDVPDGLLDGDDNTQLTEAEVDAMVADNGYALAADSFSGLFSDLTGLPDGLEDGDDNTDTLQDLACESGEIAIQTEGGWACSTLVEQLDGDGDGTLVWADCDDGDSTKGAIALDTDCDGHIIGVDCDDDDADSTHTGEDADCDGTVADSDCDDLDPASTIAADDADCDGVVAADDCNDDDASLGDSASDADCDGTLTGSDCDDSDPDSATFGSEGCPATSCKQIRSLHPTFDNGTYLIRPSAAYTARNFYCDLDGTYARAGSLRLVSAYGAYSVQSLGSCGGSEDPDCSPDADYPTPYYQGVPREQVRFDWRDADDNAVSNEWLTAYSEDITEIDVDGVRHFAFDADGSDQYKIQFSYVNGSSNSDDSGASNWGPNDEWLEWTDEGHRMMLGGQHDIEPETPQIPKIININTMPSGNWGWHIRFTEAVNDTYGIWLH